MEGATKAHRARIISFDLVKHTLVPCSRVKPRLKDTLQAETSDVRLDEVEVLVLVVVLLLQRADGVALEVKEEPETV